MNGATPEFREIGDRLRAARTARKLSLRGLADRLGVSPSLISQVERGLAKPSVNTLYAMARELDVSLDELLFVDARVDRDAPAIAPGATDGPDDAALEPVPAPVQRAHDRSSIRLASGVVWERLTAESLPHIDFLYVTYEVGGASSPVREFQRHGGREWGYIISGSLRITVGFDEYVLGPGDAITLDSTIPHRLANDGPEPVHAVWFVLGRRRSDAGAG